MHMVIHVEIAIFLEELPRRSIKINSPPWLVFRNGDCSDFNSAGDQISFAFVRSPFGMKSVFN